MASPASTITYMDAENLVCERITLHVNFMLALLGDEEADTFLTMSPVNTDVGVLKQVAQKIKDAANSDDWNNLNQWLSDKFREDHPESTAELISTIVKIEKIVKETNPELCEPKDTLIDILDEVILEYYE
jgi:hypothetical protein